MNHLTLKVIILAIFSLSFTTVTTAQSTASLECGQVLESELTAKVDRQSFTINIAAGTKLSIRVEPIGASLNPAFNVTDSAFNEIIGVNTNVEGLSEEVKDFIVSSSNPIVWVGGAPKNRTGNWLAHFQTWTSQTLGAYTISIDCTLRDPNTNGGNNPAPIPPPFSGNGFPGLPAVDFANSITNKLTLGQVAESTIPPAVEIVLGYTFEAAANNNLALSFTRVSGNLNLGLVVLSADNKVVFQASLVTSSELTTKFTLPSDGTYTIGIFRIDLLPPASPEATAFQLTATLNP